MAENTTQNQIPPNGGGWLDQPTAIVTPIKKNSSAIRRKHYLGLLIDSTRSEINVFSITNIVGMAVKADRAFAVAAAAASTPLNKMNRNEPQY